MSECKTALCYVRLSMTKDDSDLDSPERQRANILAECEKHGWIPEWHEDAEGHKSGTSEKNRPGWLALKKRLGDPDVVAVVANDLARLHRKGWRVGSLLDFLEEHRVGLALAAPGRQMDFTGPQGRLLAMLIAMMDEWYAVDGSVRQKDSARHRKARGIIVGGVPFGTVRSRESGRKGILERSPMGVWLMPDGSTVEGHRDKPPANGAAFRGYIDAAERIYHLYATGRYGRRKVAELVNAEGYRFRDVKGHPVRFDQENIRAITGNWPEYGGVVLGGKAKNRNARDSKPDAIMLNPERAILDVGLCYRVGQARYDRYRERTQAKPDHAPLTAYVYPLAGLVYCAHCDIASETSRRAPLAGYEGYRDLPRYRHVDRRNPCSALNKSVKSEVIEAEFVRLIGALVVKPEAVPAFADRFAKANGQAMTDDRRAEALAEIATCKQMIQNAEKLFLMARIDEQTLKQHIDDNERQIARLQAELSEETQIRDVLQMAVHMLTDADKNWDRATNEDRQTFARNIFSEIVYDLDTRRIVGFKLKPWIEPYLQMRAGTVSTAMLPEGLQPTSRDPGRIAVSTLLRVLYRDRPLVLRVVRSTIPPKGERNQEIFRRYNAGEPTRLLAQEFGISVRRVNRLVRRYAKHGR